MAERLSGDLLFAENTLVIITGKAQRRREKDKSEDQKEEEVEPGVMNLKEPGFVNKSGTTE
ncbi:hypothetical protein RUM44_006577 [Polyplax serrata]|uniref:Uncharacterized protein n=1 Tax=Polyplax serrata TaxID=468196 RepID=A0ABR1AIH4_POLSC